MRSVQHRLRLTMQYVYGHTGNLGDECADHAAALGTFGLVSCHNLATRWARHNFDTSDCFGSCNNIGDVLEKLRNIRTETTSLPQDGIFVLCSSSGSSLNFAHALHHTLLVLSPFPTRSLFTVPCCASSEPWKAQLRVFLPLRVLVKVSHTTCGIL